MQEKFKKGGWDHLTGLNMSCERWKFHFLKDICYAEYGCFELWCDQGLEFQPDPRKTFYDKRRVSALSSVFLLLHLRHAPLHEYGYQKTVFEWRGDGIKADYGKCPWTDVFRKTPASASHAADHGYPSKRDQYRIQEVLDAATFLLHVSDQYIDPNFSYEKPEMFITEDEILQYLCSGSGISVKKII